MGKGDYQDVFVGKLYTPIYEENARGSTICCLQEEVMRKHANEDSMFEKSTCLHSKSTSA